MYQVVDFNPIPYSSTVYKNVCVQKYRTEYEPYTGLHYFSIDILMADDLHVAMYARYISVLVKFNNGLLAETECTTEYKQDCQYEWQGEGNDKVWAPIDGTCQNVPYDECKDVEKTHARQVAYEACHEQPEESCVSVPKESCITVADEICQSEPLTKCEDVPRQSCHKEHRRVPIRVSKAVPKKTCSTNVLPTSTPAIVAPQLPAVQPRPFPEAPEEVFIPEPVPAVPASVLGPDERILDSNNIEFGAEPSEVVDVAKLTVENSSAIKFSEV